VSKQSQLKRKHRIRRIIKWTKRIAYTTLTAAAAYAFFLGISYWLHHTDVFCVKNVEIHGMRLIDRDKIQKFISFQPEDKLFEVNLDSIKTCIEELHYVASAAIGRRYPSTVKIDIVEREPAAFLVLNKVVIVDKEGCLLPKMKTKSALNDFPLITGVRQKKITYGIPAENEQLQCSLRLLRVLREQMPDIYGITSEIHNASSGNLHVYLSDNGPMIDFGKDDFERKIVKLDYFLKHHNTQMADVKLKYINLNYRDQVVVKELS